MITGVEIDFAVKDSLAALTLYERIFPVERLEVTALTMGQNEAVFTIFGSRFHMLDENPEFGLVAPKEGDPKPFWFNVAVPNIRDTYQKALDAGCTEIQPITEMPAMGASTAMFADPFGYIWQLHQIDKVVSFEERSRVMAETHEA